jgi:hypothetical protein
MAPTPVTSTHATTCAVGVSCVLVAGHTQKFDKEEEEQLKVEDAGGK